MIRVPGQPPERLLNESAVMAELLTQQLRSVMRRSTANLGDVVVAAAQDVTPDDINQFRALWANIVDSILTAAIVAQYESAAAEQTDAILTALSGVTSPQQRRQLEVLMSGANLTETTLATARNRFMFLGETAWIDAREQLVQAVAQGESIDAMITRLTSVVDDLGDTAAERIARTETIAARNEASLAVTDSVGLPTVKIWQATLDARTRPSHAAADGQTVDKDDLFSVGGASLGFPADPAGPPEETFSCRCTLLFEFDESALENLVAAVGPENDTGAMIALVPSEADAQRLALQGGEMPSELHLTLLSLGEAADIPPTVLEGIHSGLTAAQERAPVVGEAFAVSWFNPGGENPAWVLGVSGDDLPVVARTILAVVSEAAQDTDWELPTQHTPWVPHMTLAFSDTADVLDELVQRLGPITFDRLRIAAADGITDHPFTDTLTASAGETTMPHEPTDATLEGVAVIEGQPTGDGRMWTEGAITWPNPSEAIIPLEWQKETTHGGNHDVTVNVGRITSLERVGREIRFTARVDTGSPDGAEAWRRYQDGFIGGVSIVADDPEDPMGNDVELVYPEDCDGECFMPDQIIFHSSRIRALTLVNVPAFTEAAADDAVVASAHMISVPDRPPADWFREPIETPEIGLITVTDEGRVFGYVAPANVAHRGRKDHLTAPMGNVDYASWMNRPTIVAGGERIATGTITMDCGHATPKAWVGAQASLDHYDNTCSVVATARIGENKRGVWIAGAVTPGVSGEQIARMMACQLSGDWRQHRTKYGAREFVGALLVPVPGFTAPSMRLEAGHTVATTSRLRFAIRRPVVAAVIGETDLPIAERDADWDGDAARRRVFDLCTENDEVDVECVSRAFLWRDPDADPTTMGAYSLGYADVIDGRLQIVPRGVAATAGGRGVNAADIPEEDKERIRTRICSLYDQIRDEFDDWPECPFATGEGEVEGASVTAEAFRMYAESLMAGVGLGASDRAKALMEGVS